MWGGKARKERERAARVRDNPLGTHEGVAVLTRLPLTGHTHRPLSILSDWSNDDNHRALLRVTVQAPTGPVHLIVVHFSYVAMPNTARFVLRMVRISIPGTMTCSSAPTSPPYKNSSKIPSPRAPHKSATRPW